MHQAEEAEAEKAWRDMEAEEAQIMVEVEEAWKKAKEEEAGQKEAEKKQRPRCRRLGGSSWSSSHSTKLLCV